MVRHEYKPGLLPLKYPTSNYRWDLRLIWVNHQTYRALIKSYDTCRLEDEQILVKEYLIHIL